jgi:hypothetical protein
VNKDLTHAWETIPCDKDLDFVMSLRKRIWVLEQLVSEILAVFRDEDVWVTEEMKADWHKRLGENLKTESIGDRGPQGVPGINYERIIKMQKVVDAAKKYVNGCQQDYGVAWCENECISGDICKALAELDGVR